MRARLAIAVTCVASLALARPAGAEVDPTMPFDHIVVIVEQDHTYDSYFRDFTPQPDGERDGLVGLADGYVLFDNYYASSPGSTVGNMLDLTTGTTHGLLYSSKETLAALGQLDVPTVFDRMNEAGVDWRLYDGNLAEVDRHKVRSGAYLEAGASTPASLYRVPLLAMRRTWSDPSLSSRVVDQSELFADARAGTLPAVSFVLPSPTDAGAEAGEGQARLLSLVNAVAKSPQWDTTAVFVTWDDGGGQFDRATPPIGSGLRVPLLIVSPFAKRGYVSHVEHDHLSLLRLIETRFDLRPLTTEPDSPTTFEDAFTTTARAPLLGVGPGLPATPVGTPAQNLRTVLLYAAGLAGAAALAGAGWFRQRQRMAS